MEAVFLVKGAMPPARDYSVCSKVYPYYSLLYDVFENYSITQPARVIESSRAIFLKILF